MLVFVWSRVFWPWPLLPSLFQPPWPTQQRACRPRQQCAACSREPGRNGPAVRAESAVGLPEENLVSPRPRRGQRGRHKSKASPNPIFRAATRSGSAGHWSIDGTQSWIDRSSNDPAEQRAQPRGLIRQSTRPRCSRVGPRNFATALNRFGARRDAGGDGCAGPRHQQEGNLLCAKQPS